MKRRDLIKASALVGGTAALDINAQAQSKQEHWH